MLTLCFFFNAVHFQTMIFNGISILWKVVKLWNSCNFTFFFVLVEYCTLQSWALFGTLSITCINMKTNIYFPATYSLHSYQQEISECFQMHNLQTVERSHRLTICNSKEKSCLGRMSTKMWGAHARPLKKTNQTKKYQKQSSNPWMVSYHGILEEKSHQLKRGPCPHPLLPYISRKTAKLFS